MAEQTAAIAMVNQGGEIPRASDRLTALAAKNISGAPFAVEEENRLLVIRQHLAEGALQ